MRILKSCHWCPKDTLKLYLGYGFSQTKIASIFQVSTKTVKRRMEVFDLRESYPRHSEITDEGLDLCVSAVFKDFPNCGVCRMRGFLSSQGLKIQWERIHSSMWRVDPTGMILRSIQLNVVSRCHYSVPEPLALWHHDEVE